jgi:hypothetical protein
MAYFKCVVFLYSIFSWSLLIPATILDIAAIDTSKCLKQNPNNITWIQGCLDKDQDWEVVMILITILLIIHNAVISLLFATSSVSLNLNCIKNNTNLQPAAVPGAILA